jgi:hypothetical protein
MSSTESRLYRELLPILADAAGSDRFVKRAEFLAIGYPARDAEHLARESRRINSRHDAEQLASKTAKRLAQRLDNPEMDPAKLAADVPRY